jgi:hypothetical protein
MKFNDAGMAALISSEALFMTTVVAWRESVKAIYFDPPKSAIVAAMPLSARLLLGSLVSGMLENGASALELVLPSVLTTMAMSDKEPESDRYTTNSWSG